MADPLQTKPDDPPPLFALGPPPQRATTTLAAAAAARTTGKRYEQILQLLRERGPMTLFEICAHLGKEKNQISGRMTELRQAGTIEFTGDRRTDPKTGCAAEVYRVCFTSAEPK